MGTDDELMMRDWMRKHIYGVAHWEKVRDLRQGLFLARCSRCRRKYKIGIKKWWNFCPYCGARMQAYTNTTEFIVGVQSKGE